MASDGNNVQQTNARAGTSTMTLRVLTLNCWGLKYVSKVREERLKAIGDELARQVADWDVIALQEVWVFGDYDRLRGKVADELPYSKYYFSAALGAGLAILSRYPIMEAAYYPYLMGGRPIEVVDGDWFVGKGIASAVIKMTTTTMTGGDESSRVELIEILNTHMHAAGGEGAGEHNLTHRLCQAWQLARVIRGAAERGRHVVALGDFNSTPGSLVHTMVVQYGLTSDAWLQTHTNPPTAPLPGRTTSAIAGLTPERSIIDWGVTCDSPLNTWTLGKKLDKNARAFLGKRLDYIFYRTALRSQKKFRCLHSKVVFTERSSMGYSLTDHFGVEATLELTGEEDQASSIGVNNFQSSNSLTGDPTASDLPAETLARILQLAQLYYRQVQEESKVLLLFVAGCAVLLFALVIGWSFQPLAYLNWIAIILSAAAGGLGWTAFLCGWLSNKWELNHLREIIEEMEVHLHWSRGEDGLGGYP